MTTSSPVPTVAASLEWRRLGACVDLDPALFFPAGTHVQVRRQTLRAKQICHTCAVTAACLGWAIETLQGGGIWGGLDEAERNRVRPTGEADGGRP